MVEREDIYSFEKQIKLIYVKQDISSKSISYKSSKSIDSSIIDNEELIKIIKDNYNIDNLSEEAVIEYLEDKFNHIFKDDEIYNSKKYKKILLQELIKYYNINSKSSRNSS